jgi:hypothetical protein
MTAPTFDAFDESAFDTDRALTAEHGRRLVRNALAIWNDRVGHIGSAEQLVDYDAQPVTTRRVAVANWAYVGPWLYYCRQPTGTPNIDRPRPTVRMLLSGRCSVSTAGAQLYLLNERVNAPTEDKMSQDIDGGVSNTTQWYVIDGETEWTADLTVPVAPGWNRLWLAVRCDLVPETNVDLADVTYGGPYLAEYSGGYGAASSHPAVFAAGVSAQYATAYAIQIAPTPTDYAFGAFDTYTVPQTIDIGLQDAQEGEYLLWEPFRSDLSRIRPVLQADSWSDVPTTTLPVTAIRWDLAVVDFDSIAIDGTQEWSLEDYQYGAGLRWWQLPSATQYRSATDLVAIARRAVCAQVAMVQPVTTGTAFVLYPPGTLDGKPSQWVIDNAIGTPTGALLSVAGDVPFSLPTSTIRLRARIPMAGLLVRTGRRVETLAMRVAIFAWNLNTGAVIATGEFVDVLLPLLGSGGLDGVSVLARTIGWAGSRRVDDNTQYGTEGLTLRADWQRWVDVECTLTLDATTLTTTDPVQIRVNYGTDDAEPDDYWIATGALALIIEGA